jgi:hypothetical protein
MMISDEMVEKYKKELSQKILQLNLRSMKSNYYLWKPSIRLKAI